MATMTLPKPVEVCSERRLVLSHIAWGEYIKIRASIRARNVRITYDRQELEIMTVSSLHEWLAGLLGQFVEAITGVMRIPRRTGGTWTMRRRDLERGLEPDRCYYIQSEAAVRGKEELSLPEDPPPDLVIEVEITNPLLPRLEIYARMGVPEIWKLANDRLTVLLLEEGEYRESERSRALPFLPMKELERFLDKRDVMDEMEMIEEFRDWVRERMAAGWK